LTPPGRRGQAVQQLGGEGPLPLGREGAGDVGARLDRRHRPLGAVDEHRVAEAVGQRRQHPLGDERRRSSGGGHDRAVDVEQQSEERSGHRLILRVGGTGPPGGRTTLRTAGPARA